MARDSGGFFLRASGGEDDSFVGHIRSAFNYQQSTVNNRRRPAALGGQWSSEKPSMPEKDGVLAAVLCCEMVARRGKALDEQLKELCNQVGSYYPQRENFPLTPEVKEKFTEKLKSDPREFC